MPDPMSLVDFLGLHVLHSERGRLSDEFPPSNRAHIDAMLTAAEGKPNGLVLFLHGGLVGLTSALDAAERLVQDFGALADAHAVVFAWESGPLETLWNKLTPELNTVLSGTANAVAAADGAVESRSSRQLLAVAADGAEQDLMHDSLVEALESDIGLMRSVAALTGELPPPLRARADRRMALLSQVESPTVGQEMPTVSVPGPLVPTYAALFGDPIDPVPGNRNLLREQKPSAWDNLVAFALGVGRQVRERREAGRAHAPFQTAVEEVIRRARLGGWAWQSMKEDAEALGADGPEFAGSALIDALMSDAHRGRIAKLTLVAHSAGSIAACAIVDRIRASGLRLAVDVVFLAPAVSAERFARTIEAEVSSRVISRFRMYTMSDEAERADITSPLPSLFSYGHSLLYLVSGAFEVASPESGSPVVGDVPITGMRRFVQLGDRLGAGERAWVDTVERFISGHDALVLSPSPDGPAGRRSMAKQHGKFDEEGETVESVRHFITTSG